MADKSKIKKLMIAIPTHDYIHHLFVDSLLKLTQRLQKDGVNFEVVFKYGTLLYMQRDWLVDKAIEEGFSHMLWFDADMVFPEDILDLLCEPEADLVSGIAVNRHGNGRSCLFKTLGPDVRFENDDYPKDIFEIEGCGFACVLVDTKAMNYIRDRCGLCFQPMPQYSEDLTCCHNLKRYGFKMMANPKAMIGHIGQAVIYPDRAMEIV